LLLIDDIIEKVLKVSPNPECKFSSVTNGIYDPIFLFKVIDKIVDAVGLTKVDLNFSYDLKYRYKSEEDRLRVLKNIKLFHERYNYLVGV
jgi:pyruvate-formate lyase-activating enzyme